MSFFADKLPPVKRSTTEELFLIRFVAEPSPDNPEASEIGGAYVNCWVDADELRAAENRAIEALVGEQWRPTKFDHWEIVCRRCYVEDSRYDDDERRESLEQVDEAFTHGFALTFNCWPPDAPDADKEPDA